MLSHAQPTAERAVWVVVSRRTRFSAAWQNSVMLSGAKHLSSRAPHLGMDEMLRLRAQHDTALPRRSIALGVGLIDADFLGMTALTSTG